MRLLFFLIIFSRALTAQNPAPFTHADSLKGAYGSARDWWNVLHYDLHVSFDIGGRSLRGYNTITYSVLRPHPLLQIDLMAPLQLDSIVGEGRKLEYTKDGNAYFVQVNEQAPGETRALTAYYHGTPVQAKNPPWDGGVIWSTDKTGNPWISVACQGMAAQVWFPNKDHMKDEPDSATMHYTVPSDAFVVSNGRMRAVTPVPGGLTTYVWHVRNPINNYNIVPYIGRYTVIRDTFSGEGGTLDLEYWVLPESYATAIGHFRQVKPMLRCFEHWFGKYPFYEDGFKLVEAPFLGMEHQGAIAYGNEFKMGYQGRDLSNTGWGLKWDFIIVHESGHEWFGNNISAADVADNWIHEGFTAYSESLFTEYLFGTAAGAEYVRGTRSAVQNDKPVIAAYDVNAGGSLDVYYKAANMLHTIRQVVGNDSLWRQMLRGMNERFRHRTVTTAEIENYMAASLGADLTKIFDQYLRTTKVPTLEYRLRKGKLLLRWRDCVRDFNMPVDLFEGENTVRVVPRKRWSKISWQQKEFSADADYYINILEKK